MPSDFSNDDADDNSGAGEGQDLRQTTPLHFSLQYIKDLSFENPRSPEVYQNFQEPEVNINVNVGARNLAERVFEVVLQISIDARANDQTTFLIELEYAGIAHVAQNVPEDCAGFRVEVRAEESVRMAVVFEIQMPAVVTGYDNESIVVYFQLREQFADLADLPVDHVYHRCVSLRIILLNRVAGVPFFILVLLPGRFVRRQSPRTVRRCPGAITEEGSILVLANELHCLVEDQVV